MPRSEINCFVRTRGQLVATESIFFSGEDEEELGAGTQ